VSHAPALPAPSRPHTVTHEPPCHRRSDFYTACTMNERHVYSHDQLLTGRRTLCRPTLPSDVKHKVCVLGIRRRVRGTRAGRKVARLQPRPIPVRCTASRDRSNVCKHYDQLIPSSTSTLQEPLRSRPNLLRVPLDIVGVCSWLTDRSRRRFRPASGRRFQNYAGHSRLVRWMKFRWHPNMKKISYTSTTHYSVVEGRWLPDDREDNCM